MVSQNVVQRPGVGHHSCLKTVDQLQQAVQQGVSKRRYMLMVVVPGADASLGKNAQKHPENNEPNALGRKENDQINAKVGDEEGGGDPVFLVFKHSSL